MSYIDWVQAGEVWALRVPLFHVCPKSAYCSCVCHGWSAQSAIRFWLFSGSPFLYGLPYLGTGPCLTVGFAFLQLTRFPATISCHTTLSFLLRSCLPQSCCLFFSQWPSTVIGSFITSLAGFYVPFVFPWVSRAHLLSLGFLSPFLNFAFPWAFTEFFRLPWSNYIIPHPWSSWVCYQLLTFFAFITLGLSRPILTFPHHILPMICFFSIFGLL